MSAPEVQGVVQRCGPVPCNCNEDKGELQRSAVVPSVVHDVLSSPGRPLGAETQEFFGARLGHDFSRVRVHTGATESTSAQAVAARAYTVGPDIVFADGAYAPDSPAGRQLLAHELVHVVQQGGGSGSAEAPASISTPTDAPERQADAVAREILAARE
jgi:hypothetical protein